MLRGTQPSRPTASPGAVGPWVRGEVPVRWQGFAACRHTVVSPWRGPFRYWPCTGVLLGLGQGRMLSWSKGLILQCAPHLRNPHCY